MSTSPETEPVKKRSARSAKRPRRADRDEQQADSQTNEQAASPGVSEEPNSLSCWSIENREEILDQHPIVKGHYIVPTPMLKDAHQESRDRVWSRRTGVVFFGETRAGKTTCAISIKEYLEDEFKTAYITMASGRESLRPKHGLMSRLILEGSGHVLASRPDPDVLMRNVISDVVTNASNLGGDQYVLLLDEVNLLNDTDFTELLEIHNILSMKDVKMTTISFGQPEILSKIELLLEADKTQIIARFFRRPVPFLSCNSDATLAEVLRCLDEDTEWPEGSGWTYTYFFFPKAFASGFRLAKYATPIWAALTKAAPGRKTGFTMETISLMVNALYVGKRGDDAEGLILSAEDIQHAIDAADL